MVEIIGWASAAVVIPTFGLQVYQHWQSRNEDAPPLSLWFFILALIGVVGQIVYSWMLENWVYFSVNACLVVTDTIGLGLVIYRGIKNDAHSRPYDERRSQDGH